MSKNNEALTAFLVQLLAAAPHVRKRYEELFDGDLPTIPIPFFGNVANAKVVTIGLNPSDGELRSWPSSVDITTLERRLVAYFSTPQFPPHPWFQRWTEGLAELDVSYSSGTAAHVDLCPWATRRASSLPNQDLFARLVSESLPTFLRCMQFAANARLVLMAGAINKKFYLNEFLANHHGTLDFELSGRIPRAGQAFVGNHRLRIRNVQLPMFFCSVSPSARNGHLLPGRIHEHKNHLISLLTENFRARPN